MWNSSSLLHMHRAKKHVACMSVRFSFKSVKAGRELHGLLGVDTGHSDKSIMWSCFRVWRRGTCVFVCSTAGQMFPIFNFPLALLDAQESISLCRTYLYIPPIHALREQVWSFEFIIYATWHSCGESLSRVIGMGGCCLKECRFWPIGLPPSAFSLILYCKDFGSLNLSTCTKFQWNCTVI